MLQVEPHERGAGLLRVKVRQTKVNFGEMIVPFGIQLEFSEEAVRVKRYALEADALAEERSLSLREKILLTLASGPAFAKEIAEATDGEYQSVKNTVSQLRREGLVEDTGELKGQSRRVRLTNAGSRVTQRNGVITPIGDEYAITLSNEKEGGNDQHLGGKVVNGVYKPETYCREGQGAQGVHRGDRDHLADDDAHRHPWDCMCDECVPI